MRLNEVRVPSIISKPHFSVDSRNFEMWGRFPPMSEKCGGSVNKNGNLLFASRITQMLLYGS